MPVLDWCLSSIGAFCLVSNRKNSRKSSANGCSSIESLPARFKRREALLSRSMKPMIRRGIWIGRAINLDDAMLLCTRPFGRLVIVRSLLMHD